MAQPRSMLLLRTALLTSILSLTSVTPVSAQVVAPDTNNEVPQGEPTNSEANHSYVCVNASRGGLSLEIPGLDADGKLTGSLRLFKLARTIREIPAERLTDYLNDGETISMKGVDSEGRTQVSVKTFQNDGRVMPRGRAVQTRFKGLGMIAFTCKRND